MRNKKLLSILTAGALAVSSFSGLMLNGNVARAAAPAASSGTAAWITVQAGTSDTDVILFHDSTAIYAGAAGDLTFAAAATAKIATATEAAARTGALAAVAAGAPAATAIAGITVTGDATPGLTLAVPAGTEGVAFVGYDVAAQLDATAATVRVARIVTSDKPITTNGTTDAGAAYANAVAGQSYTVMMNDTLFTNLGLDESKITWAINAASTGTGTLGETAGVSTTSGKSVTLKIDDSALIGQTLVLDLKANNVVIDTITYTVSTLAAKPMTTFALYESINKTDVTGGTVALQRNDNDVYAEKNYNQVTIWPEYTATANGEEVVFVTAGASTARYAWRLKELKYGGEDKAINTAGTYFTKADGANGEARFTADQAITKDVSATYVVEVSGIAYDKATMLVPQGQFADSRMVTITIKPTLAVSIDVKMAEQDAIFEDGDMDLRTVYAEATSNGVRVTQDNLYYVWELVTDRTVNNVKVFNNDLSGKTDVAGRATTTAVADGTNIFELVNAGEHTAAIQVGLLGTNNAANTYRVYAFAYRDATAANKDSARANYLAYDYQDLKVLDNSLVVTLDTTVFGETGEVTIGAEKQDFDGAVTATRSRGVDVTKNTNYKVVDYRDFLNTLESQTTIARTYDALNKVYGVEVNNGKVTVRSTAQAGSYIVLAREKSYGATAASNDLIVVRSKAGVAVTGLDVDYNTVTIDNLNSTATIYATVLPVSYLSNGYIKDSASSAEIDAIEVSSADESVATVELTGAGKPVGVGTWSVKTYDNTWGVRIIGHKKGETTVTITTVDGGFTQKVAVSVSGEKSDEPEPTPEPTPEPEHKAGDAFTVDGVSVFVNADGKTLTVTDVAVVGKTATIPATVDGLEVTTIAAQAFKKSDAKTIYVKAAVTDIEKGAFKKAKTKKIFFYEPAALNTVAKNAFKGANVKVVGVGGSFSESAASQLKKAGASKVKNNGTAK